MVQSDLDNIAYNKFANGEITLAEYIKYKNRDKIMEKKEAMKILKDFRDKSALFSVRTALDTIIPELKESKESEDERIRKELIQFIKNWKDYNNIGRPHDFPTFTRNVEQCDRYIAWLEKQGTTYTKRDVDDAYLKGVTNTKNEIEKQYEANYQIRKDIATFIFNYRGDIKDRAKWMDYLGIKVSFVEKQGEQKPADKVEQPYKVEPKFKVKYAGNEYNVLGIKEIAGVTYYGIEDEPNHIDYILPDNCEIIRNHGYGVKEKGSPYPTKSAIFSEQKPAEWSEEDERIYYSLLADIRTRQDGSTNTLEAHYNEQIDWLKSLKQRKCQGLNPNKVIEWLKPYGCVVGDIVEQFKKDFEL